MVSFCPSEDPIDILYSERAFDLTNGSTGADTYFKDVAGKVHQVQISFKHALSYIKFQAKRNVEDENTIIKIKSIRLKNAYQYGNFIQDIDESDLETTKPSTEKAKWTPGNYTTVSAYGNLLSNDFTVSSTTAQDVVYGNDKDFLIMPQPFDKKFSGFTEPLSKMYFEIIYTMKTEGVDNEIEYTFNQDLKDLTYDGVIGTNQGFEVGKKYTFLLTFTLDKVYFNPIVENWDNVEVTGSIAVE